MCSASAQPGASSTRSSRTSRTSSPTSPPPRTDHSGNVGCTATDRAEPLNGPNTVWWSSARWISRIADEYGIPKVGGNPGYSTGNATAYSNTGPTGMMATVMNMATSCGYSGLYWAHDDQFYNGILPLSALTAYGSPTATTPANASDS